MKILVIGSGGREHAIVWKLKQSPLVTEIFCAPGNGGIGETAKCLPCAATDFEGLVKIAKEYKIDFTVVGMDDPLVYGIVDEFNKHGLKIFGPDKKAAQIEGSKAYAKYFMKKYNIPTADYDVFDNYDEALMYITKKKYPLVIKADGLALGKGVVIANNIEEAQAALYEIMIDMKFGGSGERVVIEELLCGHEITMLAFCDGKTIIPMVSAQDHKRAFDNDCGPNTGGMGTISPSRYYSEELADECMNKIFLPTVAGLIAEERPFKGILYFGLMLTAKGVKVIEYNCRFGDPEAQVVLPRLDSDLLEIMLACNEGRLCETDVKWKESAACCVMLASGGYPGKYSVGYDITLPDKPFDGFIFHSGTKYDCGRFITAGGRVLGITAEGEALEAAIENAYRLVKEVSFKDMYYRKDIGRVR